MKKIAVVGAGSWGTTLACLLGDKKYNVKVWAFENEVAEQINNQRENRNFLPGIKIPASVSASTVLKDVVSDAELIVMGIPSPFLRSVAKEMSKFVMNGAIIVDLAKGLEKDTYKRMSQILEEELPNHVKIVALSGPNHAEEVSKKIPTASVIASKNAECLKKVENIFNTDYFKVYPLADIVGVEICGAVKNITAIATGICAGLGLGDNAQGAIITLGLTEMNRFGREFGAKRATCYGLAGVGDLVATCTSKHSRNRFVGKRIAEGKSMDEITKEMHGMVAEGVKSAQAVYDFSVKHGLDMPLTTQVYKVLYEGKDIHKAVSDFLRLI